MGKQARKIVGVDVKKLINDLNKAYCDEWLAFYSYRFMGQVVSGVGYEDMAEFLNKTADIELEHSRELADRIVELGGTPVAQFGMIEKNANVAYPVPPDKTDDYNAIVSTVLAAEAAAIDVYQAIANETFGKDHVTHNVVMHILSEEIQHEEMFENLGLVKQEVEPVKKEAVTARY
ncbi:MAG: hypothetical protein A2314_08855 [Elusimicrobia bacterium RIFOXYB2_FULL_50_12]|nr:MAG: hypothetical protein A2314_08855 [Elusimicrobia bacterium RIFOXYB2_FULL_50_12]